MRRVGCSLLASRPSSLRLRPMKRAFASSAARLHEGENDTQLAARSGKHPSSDCHHYLYYHSSSQHRARVASAAPTAAAPSDDSYADSDRADFDKWTPADQAVQEEVTDTSSFSREFEKPHMDASFLVNNYTAPALAAAYQDREYTLWLCAELLSEGKLDELEAVLKPYHDFAQHEANVQRKTPLQNAFGQRHLERIRKRLSRLPRQITKAYSQRAAVVIPLCTYEGEPSVLFTLRSLTVGKHKGEVCFPGGMVDANDSCIEGTCLREMNEEVGLAPEGVDVLGVLRCDWSSVTSITGIAVTPVVGFIGEMSDQTVAINEDEVESLFTVPLRDLLNQDNWVRHSNATPVFTGGPHVIWGLTAYLLDICLSEVLQISD